MDPHASTADAVVCGAGPTGLMLGAELLRQGIAPLIVDLAPAPSPLSRAIVVHARTLEILEAHDLAAPLVAAGVPLRRVHIRSERRTVIDVGFDALPTRYPFLLSVPQHATEALLADRIAALGGRVVRGVRVASFAQDADGVDVQLSDDDATWSVRARWLVGCDGAHSTVRRGLGLDFAGHAHADRLALADVRWEADLPRDALSTFLDAGALACFPLPDDRWRLIALRTADGGEIDESIDLAGFAAIVLKRTGIAVPPTDPTWIASFRTHTRGVDRYRIGRVLLAGDAAHIHSPFGGQGMNTGIQDAHNLGWKIALALRGAPEALVDSYERERHPIAAQVLRATDAATRIGTTPNRLIRTAFEQVAAQRTNSCERPWSSLDTYSSRSPSGDQRGVPSWGPEVRGRWLVPSVSTIHSARWGRSVHRSRPVRT